MRKKGEIRIVAILAVVITLFLLTAYGGQAGAATYYVATTGSDSNAGTSSAPFQTIQHAIDTASCGDIVHVTGGTYNVYDVNSDTNLIMKTGVSVVGDGPANTILDGFFSAGSQSYNGGVVDFNSVTNAVLKGVTITTSTPLGGYDRGVVFEGVTDSTAVLENCVVTGMAYIGMFVWSPATPTIQNNVIVGTSTSEQGIYIGNSATSPHILNNVIDIWNYGIHVVAGTTAPTPVIEYNDVYQTSTNYWTTSNPPYPDQTGINGNISADPLFVSFTDYHLTSSSPCIDAGAPGSQYYDYDGGRNDMGAYGGPFLDADYFVAPFGSDSNTGTPAAPFATIQHAIDTAGAGSIVDVAAGTYNENITMKSGVSVVGNSPRDTSIVGTASTSGVVGFFSVNQAALKGFTITVGTPVQGTDRAVVFDGSSTDSTAVLQNCIITNTQYGVFVQNGSSPLIQNNTFYAVTDEQGIYIDDTSNPTTGPTVLNNIITGYYGDGIHLISGTPSISYNDVWNNATDYLGVSAGPNDISSDPLFVGPNDLRLGYGSPCIDTGDPASQYDDYDGSVNDMGAFGGRSTEMVQPLPAIGVSSSSLNFTTVAGVNPSPQNLSISNTCGGVLRWDTSWVSNWLGLNPVSGANTVAVSVSPDVTVLSVGVYNDTITINDSSATNSPQTVSVSLTVNKATPSVTTWPTASAITYGQTLASSTLSGGSASVPGSFAFTTPTTAPNTGTASQSVTFTPTDTTNYNTVAGSVSVTVNKATPSVTTWPTASAITYGQTLASSTLSGGTASVAGTFAFTTPSTVPPVGNYSASVTFTPTDTTNYNTVTGSVNVTVSCQAITVTPATIPDGSLGSSYSQSFGNTGGIGTVTYTETGALPATMTFLRGTLSGTPTETGSFPITVTATDSNGCQGSQNYDFHIWSGTCTGQPSGLVSWWKAEGNADDQTGLNNGTLMNGATFTSGMVGQAFSFSTHTDYVSIPDNASLQFTTAMSVAAWIRVDGALSQFAPIITKGDFSWRLQREDVYGYIDFGTSVSTDVWDDLVGSRTIDDGQWHHVVGVFDGTTKYLYVDGTLDASDSWPNTINVTTDEVRIGSNTFHPERYWDGPIDEVQLYNRALTAQEVAGLYNAGPSGMCTETAVSVSPSSPFDFGSVTVSGSNTQTFTISSTGTAGLSISNISLAGTDYTLNPGDGTGGTCGTAYPIVIAPGGRCTVDVTFSPSSGGLEGATLSVSSNDPGSPSTVAISGTGSCPPVTLQPTSQSVSAAGATNLTFTVNQVAGCGWTAGSTDSWINVATTSGSGTGTVTYSVSSNAGVGRVGTITAGGQTFTVNQDSGCTFTIAPVSPSPAGFPATGGTGTFSVTASDGTCPWSAVSGDTSWVTTTASGIGSGTGNYTVLGDTGASRSASISVGGQSFSVSQASGCAYTLSPASQSMPAAGGSFSVTVTATSPTCSWTAGTTAPWITGVTGGATGNGTVNYTIDLNAGVARFGTISIGGQSFRVSQESGCTFTISAASPNPADFTATGGTGTFTVTASDNSCAWSATSNAASWLTTAAGGTGSGTGSYSVSGNTGAPRSAAINVGGSSFAVNQTAGCAYTLTPASQAVPESGGNFSIGVTATSPDCAWTATTGYSWIMVLTGGATGSGTVNYIVGSNLGAARAGTISIGGQSFSVSQSGLPTVTITAGPGGTTLPSGTIVTERGSTLTVYITPDPGYVLSDVTVDGISMGPMYALTLKNLEEDHSITVTFK